MLNTEQKAQKKQIVTCGFCGTELQNKYCKYCNMDLKDKHITKNGDRIDNTVRFYPAFVDVFKPTNELMQLETIELLCLLKMARQIRSDICNTRIQSYKTKKSISLEKQGCTENVRPKKDLEKIKKIEKTTRTEYENATKRVWVIENIIKERVGYFPRKISDDFIESYSQRIKKSQEKQMVIQAKMKPK